MRPIATTDRMPKRSKLRLTRKAQATGTCWNFSFRFTTQQPLIRQGNDRGASYRSAIFYTTDTQKQVALDAIEDVNASGHWPGKVVTEVEQAGPFWEAEPEHQDYLQRIPNGYTCHFVRPDWVLPNRNKAEAK